MQLNTPMLDQGIAPASGARDIPSADLEAAITSAAKSLMSLQRDDGHYNIRQAAPASRRQPVQP